VSRQLSWQGHDDVVDSWLIKITYVFLASFLVRQGSSVHQVLVQLTPENAVGSGLPRFVVLEDRSELILLWSVATAAAVEPTAATHAERLCTVQLKLEALALRWCSWPLTARSQTALGLPLLHWSLRVGLPPALVRWLLHLAVQRVVVSHLQYF
jgi:hypothetical protein